MRTQLASWIAMSCLTVGTMAQTASAGQIMDSILNRRNPAYPVGQVAPPTTYATPPNYASVVANYGPYAAQPVANPAGTLPAGSIPLGFPQTVAGYLPTASYDTRWTPTPVTYYRPVTSFDPRTGTTVTSLQPCTSTQYQAQRVPLVAPAPLLGDYGFQANRWPSITGPGYYPAGVSNNPYYPGFQQLPPNGAPLNAPLGTTGSSMGMPSTSLPLTTINSPQVAPPTYPTAPYAAAPYAAQYAAPPYPTAPYPTTQLPTPVYPAAPYATATPYPSAVVPAGGPIPSYTSPATITPIPSSQPVGSGVVGSGVAPAASFSPTTTYSTPSYVPPSYGTTAQFAPNGCANGVCPMPSNPMSTNPIPSNPTTIPNIPGATSVQPLGPPTYTPVPTTPTTPSPGSYPPPSGSYPPPAGAYPPPHAGSDSVLPNTNGGAVLPNNPYPSIPSNPQQFPPIGGGVPGQGLPIQDPDSMRQPTLNGASVQKPGTDHFVGLTPRTIESPAVEPRPFEPRTAETRSEPNNNEPSSPSLHELSTHMLQRAPSNPNPSLIDQALMNRGPVPVPPTLRPSTNEAAPSQTGGGSTGSGNGGSTIQNRAVPLSSPQGFTPNQGWSPSLVDPNDPVAKQETTPISSTQPKIRFISNQ